MSGHTGGHGGKCANYGGYYGGGHENGAYANEVGEHTGHSGNYMTVKCITEDHYECFVSVPTRGYSTDGKSTSTCSGMCGTVSSMLSLGLNTLGTM